MEKSSDSREIYIRVSSVLYPFSGLQNIDEDVVANAARRGTKIHKICEGIVSGLGEVGVDDEVRGYIDSFNKWWATGIDVVEMEKRFWDDDLRITGQVDFIIKTPDGLIIADLKTSSRVSKTWQVQGAAYAMLARKAGYDIKKTVFIHLNKHGTHPTIYEYPVDDSFFLSVLRTYLHFYHKAQ